MKEMEKEMEKEIKEKILKEICTDLGNKACFRESDLPRKFMSLILAYGTYFMPGGITQYFFFWVTDIDSLCSTPASMAHNKWQHETACCLRKHTTVALIKQNFTIHFCNNPWN